MTHPSLGLVTRWLFPSLVCFAVSLAGMSQIAAEDVTLPADFDQSERRQTTLKIAQQNITGLGKSATARDWSFLGDAQLRAGKVKMAIESFEKSIQLNPMLEPHLWQYGIALALDGQYDKGKDLFEKHRVVNPHDVENAAWHFLCVAKSQDINQARKIVLPAPGDRRPPMKEILERLSGGDFSKILATMKRLENSDQGSASFYGHLYIGLIADAEGNLPEARKELKTAAQTPFSHYMADVARIYHARLKSQPGVP